MRKAGSSKRLVLVWEVNYESISSTYTPEFEAPDGMDFLLELLPHVEAGKS
jgi:hypothetical protein